MDEYLYAKLVRQEMTRLSGSESVRLTVGDLAFDLPHACREPFRRMAAAAGHP